MDTYDSFGQFFKEMRLRLNLTLRKFSQIKGLDSAYISRIENDLIIPPDDQEKLRGLAIALELQEGTSYWVTFFDLAYTCKGKLPKDILEEYPRTLNYLPAFLRSSKKENLKVEDIEDLIKLIKGKNADAAPKE